MAERPRTAAAARSRLDQPVAVRTALPRPHYDPEAFGRLSERIARFLGTARFLVYQSVFIAAWVTWNALAPTALQFDPYTFTFLTLILSLQAAYAAPLILLAQNRQADRDRINLEEDRGQNERMQADVEYLTREVAALRQSVGEVATRDFLRDQLREVTEEIVARGGAAAATADPSGSRRREEREERERRAERKKRRAAKLAATEPVSAAPSLSEPFVGQDPTS